MEYQTIFYLSIILFSTKLFSIISKRMHLPQVVGALVAGLILGEAFFSIVPMNENLSFLADIGVILLMFNAGIETDLKNLKKSIGTSIIVSILGVIFSISLGYLIGITIGLNNNSSLFLGLIISSTSMSITVETLQELKKLKTKTGTTILGASIIDDLIGVILLTIMISTTDSNNDGTIFKTLINFVAFFCFSFITGIVAKEIIRLISNKVGNTHRISIFSLAFAFLLSYVAEYFGIASITGAYLAGLFLGNMKTSHYVETKTQVLSYMLFSPIFFASIGLKAILPNINLQFILITSALILFSFVSKIIGCGLGAKISKFSIKDSLKIGSGMASRGEVSLIIADKGLLLGLISPEIFSPIIIVVITTTLITPILLTKLYK